jgi:hypothetical protein
VAITLDRGLALILVGGVDRRVVPALALATQLQEFEARAVHLAFDLDTVRRLADDWMGLGLAWLPLHVEEPAAATLADSIRSVVEREVREHSRVLVVVPELDLPRWWQPLLHRGAGRRIARHLQDMRRVSTVVLPYCVEATALVSK